MRAVPPVSPVPVHPTATATPVTDLPTCSAAQSNAPCLLARVVRVSCTKTHCCLRHNTVSNIVSTARLLAFDNTGADVSSACSALAVGAQCWLSRRSVFPPCCKHAVLFLVYSPKACLITYLHGRTAHILEVVRIARHSLAATHTCGRLRRPLRMGAAGTVRQSKGYPATAVSRIVARCGCVVVCVPWTSLA